MYFLQWKEGKASMLTLENLLTFHLLTSTAKAHICHWEHLAQSTTVLNYNLTELLARLQKIILQYNRESLN